MARLDGFTIVKLYMVFAYGVIGGNVEGHFLYADRRRANRVRINTFQRKWGPS